MATFFGDEIQAKMIMDRLGIKPHLSKAKESDKVSIDFNEIMTEAKAL